MKYLKDISDNIDEIDLEIRERKDLMSQMVGTLYPAMLQGEIDQLKLKKYRLLYSN